MSVMGDPVEVVACAREKKMPSGPALNRKYLPRGVPAQMRSVSDTLPEPVELCALRPGWRMSWPRVRSRATAPDWPPADVVLNTLPLVVSVWSALLSPICVLLM